MAKAPDAPGMRGYRSRDKSGPLRGKRSDTLVKDHREAIRRRPKSPRRHATRHPLERDG